VHFKIYLEVELGLNVKKKFSQKNVLQFNGMIRTKIHTDDADEVALRHAHGDQQEHWNYLFEYRWEEV
jgi:predicted metal-dependent RNase